MSRVGLMTKTPLSSRSIMLVHAKAPRIKVRLSGPGTARIVEAVRKAYPQIRVEDDDDDELIDITKTEWCRKMEANHHPGITSRVYRTTRGWTWAASPPGTGT